MWGIVDPPLRVRLSRSCRLGAPINQAKPAVTGTAAAGQKLRCDTGSWAGFPTCYSYQ
jgi:hypothetical protein